MNKLTKYYQQKIPIIVKNILLAISIFFLFLILFYLINRFILDRQSNRIGGDFGYLWVAGRLWLKGQNPYDTLLFLNEYQPHFEFKLKLERAIFAYPPTWAPVTMFLALFPFQIALLLWTATNIISLIAIIVITAFWLKSQNFKVFWQDMRLWLGACYCFLMQSNIALFFYGQTGIIATLGAILIIYATSQNAIILGIIGGYLLLLKPQLAVILFTTLFVAKNYKIIIGTMALTFLASGLAFLRNGVVENIQGFLGNLSKYTLADVNKADHLVGFKNLLYHYTSLDIPSKLLPVFGIIIGIVCGVLISRYRGSLARGVKKYRLIRLQVIILTFTATLFLMPLHTFDLIFCAPALIASLYLPLRQSIWFIPGWVCLFQPRLLAKIISHTTPADLEHIFVASWATLFLLLASIFVLITSVKNLNHSAKLPQN